MAKNAIRREDLDAHLSAEEAELRKELDALESEDTSTAPKVISTDDSPFGDDKLKPPDEPAPSPEPRATPEPEPKPEPAPEPAPEPPPAPEPTPEPPPEPAKEAETLKAQLAERDAKLAEMQSRLDRQSGDYGGNLDRMRGEIRELNQTVTSLESESEATKRENERLKGVLKEHETPTQPLVSDEFRENYPEIAQQLDGVQSRHKLEMEKLNLKVQDAEKGMAERTRKEFWERLLGAVPDYESTVRHDPTFISMITTPDEYGRKLIDDLARGEANCNPVPFIKAVEQWRSSRAPKEPTVEEKETAAQAEKEKKDKIAAEAAPTPAADTKTKPKPSTPAEEAKVRQARMKAFTEKFQKDFRSVTPEEKAQNAEDDKAERDYQLTLAGHTP